MQRYRFTPVAMVMLMAGSAAQAEIFQGEEVNEVDEARWEAEIDYGLVMTTGNTETESNNGSLVVVRERPKWRQRTSLGGLRTVDQGETVAERYTASYKVDYRFRPRDYGFLTARYEDDRFSGYDYRASEAVGYGRMAVDGPRVRLDLEVGVGMIHEQVEDGDRSDDRMGRLAANLRWQIRKQARFQQTVLVERSSSTYVESDTSLSSQVVENLAMRASYQVRHHSEVPEETENTDTITSLSLVYSF